MWTNTELKQRAKVALTGTYWKAFAISLIIAFVSGGGGGSFSFMQNGDDFGSIGNRTSKITSGSSGMDTAVILGMIGIFIGIFALIMIIALGFTVFVGYPVMVGGKKYFIEAAEAVDEDEQAKFNLLGHGFKGPYYFDIIKTMFIKNLYIFLWSLLFVIPGIVKSYTYAMVPYILADNPNIGVQRAIEISKQMTDGEKMDMFILDLSFVGWFLLALIPCGFGLYFLNPYYYSTHVELYRVLREKSLDSNICTFEELGFATPSEEVVENTEVESTIIIENKEE